LEAAVGKHSTDPLQKTVVLGTLNIIRKVLQCERWGSALVHEKYQGENDRGDDDDSDDDDDDNNNNNNNNNRKHCICYTGR
jgi:hypothetical protein